MALCPHCEATVTRLHIQEMTSSVFMGTQWLTVAYVCPTCQKIISAQIDPIAIKTDTVKEIKNRI